MTERYSPAEAKLALARAAELQVARERSTVGMTRDELVRISVDTGLDADLLERALAELDASRVEFRVEEGMARTVVSAELRRPLGEDEREELGHRLAHEHGVRGRWEQRPDGAVWHAPGLELTVRPTTDGALLRAELPRRWPLFAMFLGVPAASGALALAVSVLLSWKWAVDPIAWATFLGSLAIGWAGVYVVRTHGTPAPGQRLVALLERALRRLPPAASTNSQPPHALQEGE